MKQHTNESQTAKLIELGFDMPKSKVGGKVIYEPDADLEIEWEEAYSIGELIEMLSSALSPNNDDDCEFHLMLFDGSLYWHVRYVDGVNFCYPSQAIELIDALYDVIVLLKEEGVI